MNAPERMPRAAVRVGAAMMLLGAACFREPSGGSGRDAAVDGAAIITADAAATSCTRDGPIDPLEHATECAVRCLDIADPRRIKVSLTALGGRVMPGGPGAVLARIANVGNAPVALCLRLESNTLTGWDKVAGVAPPAPDTKCEHPHFPFPLRTLDARDASVDELDTNASVLCTRTVRVVLLPGRSLTKTLQWAAIRLPAAPRPWEDDAGRRYYAKAIPVALRGGSYRIETELPFFDAPIELRRASTVVDVSAE